MTKPHTQIQTAPSFYFDFRKPDDYVFSIEEAAHAACNTCRFNGHTSRFYSVGEHLVIGCWALERRGAPAEAIQGWLVHDLHEPYLPYGDATSPAKRLPEAQALVTMEHEIQEAFLDQCVDYQTYLQVRGSTVKYNDLLMVCFEAIHFMGDDVSDWRWRDIPKGYFDEARDLPAQWSEVFSSGFHGQVKGALLEQLNRYDLV